MKWEKQGILIGKTSSIDWLKQGSGPATPDLSSLDEFGNIDLLISGRNKYLQSLIGKVNINLETFKLNKIESEPVLELGALGLFDYSGTSYPQLVNNNSQKYLYYTGWFLGKDVPFINDLGLAIFKDNNKYEKISKATITPRTNKEPYGIGSVYVLKERNDLWKMWYTCFEKWGDVRKKQKHFYNIKYAESKNGINWDRIDKVAINFNLLKGEYVTAKPSVLKYKNYYFMWYSYRGEAYKIGFAFSKDGINWQRIDDFCGINCSNSGWDSQMICYSNVFKYKEKLIMTYCGNNYGKDGLGIATIDKAFLDEIIQTIIN